MPKYTILLSKQARKQLDNLSDYLAKPILDAISSLAENPHPNGYLKLKAREGYRIRVGDYRVIYEIIDTRLIVDVIAIGNRKEIYR